MFVLAVLYTFEPAIMGMMGDVETGDAIWKACRLAVLCTTVLMAAKLLIDLMVTSLGQGVHGKRQSFLRK